jgi:serine/threonine protein kinase
MSDRSDGGSSFPPAKTLNASAKAETIVSGERLRVPSIVPPSDAGERLWGGRIRIVAEVGRGAMAQVLRGTDLKLGRDLALKVLPLPRSETPRTVLARFAEEAQVTAQLEHPNIVPVHNLGVDPDGRAYFSMKLIRGQSLESILEKRQKNDPETLERFGLRRLLDVFLQVCQAIEYAHARGVIHRDLKPANIMVGDFGEVLVADWGVAKLKDPGETSGREVKAVDSGALDEAGETPRGAVGVDVKSIRAGQKAWATQTGTVIGTPAYMSPEQASGAAVDERTDVYSLGVILYEILCGEVPFDDEEAVRIITRVLTEAPRRPSQKNPLAPLALEALALRLLEKKPERRTITIPQIRAHVQNYIEGIGVDYRPAPFAASLLWIVTAVVLFAFLVWYLTGRSIASVLALGPPAVLNAVGWFVLVVALGYPLWGEYLSLQQRRVEHDRFREANRLELFVARYLAHRTFSAAVAPVFQLGAILELVSLAIFQTPIPQESLELPQQVSYQLRAEWAQALIVVLLFMFAYLVLLSTEVRFARKLDRYDLLVRRPAWESLWPLFLIVVLLLGFVMTGALDWVPDGSDTTWVAFFREQVLAPPLNVFEIAKNMVFQGTFLLGLVAAGLLLAFPFAEVLASLRMAYYPADEAQVASHSSYFMRSLAIFRVARANWLYGGAMIGSLTAITVLTESNERPLVAKALDILGPSLVGFLGYWATRRYVRTFLQHAPTVRRLVEQGVRRATRESRSADLAQLEMAPRRWLLLQLTVPVLCIAGYLAWTGSGMHQQAIRQLILPDTKKEWLLILPYAFLVPVLLARDGVHKALLRRLTSLPAP